MPPISWWWPMMVEADDGGMAVEIEPFQQYSFTFCCCVTDASRGAVWPSRVWHGSAYKAKGCHWILHAGKNRKKLRPFILAKYLQRTISGCEHSEAVGVWCVSMGQQWYERQAMFQMTMHSFHAMKWRTSRSAHPHESINGGDYIKKQCFVAEDLLYRIVLLSHFLSYSFHGNK